MAAAKPAGEPAPPQSSPAPEQPAPKVAPTPAPVDPHADVVLDEMKDYYGLKVAEVDGWKPAWEPDTTGIAWSKPGHVPITMVLNEKPIERVEDSAADRQVCDTLVSRGAGDERPVVPPEMLVKVCDGADLP